MSKEKKRPISRRARDFAPRGMPRGRDYAAEEDEFDIDLDEILDVEEDEIEEVPEDECPPGCVPAEEVEEEVEELEEAVEEAEEEDREKEAQDEEVAEEVVAEAEEEPEEPTEATLEEPVTEDPPAVEQRMWAPLYNKDDLDRVTADAVVDLWLHEDEVDPHYIVLANGRPIAEIRRSDLKLDDDSQGLFTQAIFPQGLTENIEKMGLKPILDEIGARYYADQVTHNAAEATAKAEVAADMESAYQERLAELKRKLLDNITLAVEGSVKNVFLKNPLRDAVRKAFIGLGIPDAVIVDLFEDAMQRSASEYFKTIIDQADEWMGFEKEALAQVKKAITQAEYSHPADRGLPIDPMLETRQADIPARSVSAPPPQRRAEVDSEEAGWDRVRNVLRNAGTLARGK